MLGGELRVGSIVSHDVLQILFVLPPLLVVVFFFPVLRPSLVDPSLERRLGMNSPINGLDLALERVSFLLAESVLYFERIHRVVGK